jgi:hypothetical protein
MNAKLTVRVRGNMIVVFFPDGSFMYKHIPRGMTGEQAIKKTIELLLGSKN